MKQAQPIWMRLRRSLLRQGIGTTLVKICAILADHWFDLRHGTDTCRFLELDNLTIASSNKDRGALYSPTRVLSLRPMFAVIRKMMPAESVLVDFGCGKGRVLLVALECGFRRVRGVEFAHELCEIALENYSTFARAGKLNCEYRIIECDAACYRVNPDENVFFMFNPFDEPVMTHVLDAITASLKEYERPIVIAYHLPKYGELIERVYGFRRLRDVTSWGHTIALYSNSF